MSNLLSINGCIKRKEWWLINLTASFITCLCTFFLLLPIIDGDLLEIDTNTFIICNLLLSVLSGFITYICLCATIKRLHDRNKSGYFAFLSFVPFANLYILWLCGFKASVEDSPYRE